ncbi:ABC transporter ATP-binding protein [Pseudonocardia nematodicida]|uniref:ABC transporter ATP-binding protein n=1 Tax=Pseudonocardia nematodicida TaxID=1206997 RepID=A0ABV1KGE8_9PSEU
MLEVEGLWVGYGDRDVLRDVSFSVGGSEVVAVLGTNGAGKSTLLNCLAGLIAPAAGAIRFRGEDITGRPAWSRPASGMALVPEGQQSFPAMTVQENLWVGGRVSAAVASRYAQNLDRVFDLFPRLAERRDQAAGTLSGGERQMLAVGRALVAEPALLMLDEPSHGLAPLVIERIADMVDLIAETTALLVVEQNLLIPSQCATRVLVLEESRIVSSGAAAEVLASDLVAATYLGTETGR